MIVFHVQPGGKLCGELRVPGDKSISHRSIMLGALAEGETRITGYLQGEDNLATLNAFRAMGVHIDGPDEQRIIIQGVGLQGLRQPEAALYLGNSGTSMRLLAGLLAGQRFDSELHGDASLNKRPMERITKPLKQMGARVFTNNGGLPPLRIQGSQSLQGIRYDLAVASAQVKSCLLLAGLYAKGQTCIHEPVPTRDHTERMLLSFGYPVLHDDRRVCVQGGGRLKATHVEIPADISSAAFFMVGASITPGSEIILQGVGVNPTRMGVINILRHMGADISLQNEAEMGGEPVADICVRSSELQGITIPQDQVPLAIDEFPALFIAAACARGETVLHGARELRVKESDRILIMAEGLHALGIEVYHEEDGIVICGGTIQGGKVASHGDHRIAMAFAMAGLQAKGEICIDDCANVDTSFPGFIGLARQAGLAIFSRREGQD